MRMRGMGMCDGGQVCVIFALWGAGFNAPRFQNWFEQYLEKKQYYRIVGILEKYL